ncbi:MAG: PIN domain-containing protein [Deltaproteobacteria bacterium]|nr:PIN domain-containing protein [Deltaproteobacteria bacterium]
MIPQKLKRFLQTHEIISLDTSIFIYFVEEHPVYYSVCDEVFREMESGHIKASTSTLSLLEILVKPYKLDNDDLILKFYSLFTTYPNLSWVGLSIDIADRAARIRGKYNLKTPDSIQIASAISAGSTGIICNDKEFKKIEEIECLVLDDLIQSK